MPNDKLELLKLLARRYIWWKSPDEAARDPRRVIAQVMNLGDWDDANACGGAWVMPPCVTR